MLPGFSLTGLGLGLAVVALTRTVTSHADPDQLGLASGILTTTAQVGFALGSALVAVVTTTTGYLVDAIVCAVAIAVALTLISQRTDQPATRV